MEMTAGELKVGDIFVHEFLKYNCVFQKTKNSHILSTNNSLICIEAEVIWTKYWWHKNFNYKDCNEYKPNAIWKFNENHKIIRLNYG